MLDRRGFLKTVTVATLGTILPRKLYSAESDEFKIYEYVRAMPLSQRINQTLMYCAGNSKQVIPDSNIILMGWSFGAYKSLVAANQKSEIKGFVAVDQEGGRVYRLRNNRRFRRMSFPSIVKIGKMPDEQVFEKGKEYGGALNEADINLLLTCLDVSDTNRKMYRDRRVFGSDVETVITKATAYFKGVRETHPLVTILGQHFPGYNISANTDVVRGVDNSPIEEIARRAEPFFKVDVNGAMVSSIVYSNVSNEIASLDDRIVDWTRDMGRNKILMSDDFRGLVRQFKRRKEFRNKNLLKEAVIRMFETDMDIMLMIPRNYAINANKYLQEYIGEDKEREKQLNKKVKRIMLRKYQTGLFEF